MKKFDDIKTVFIDLDDTIWDFTANSKVAMRMVYDKFGLNEQSPYEAFIDCYLKHNSELWTLYHHGKITKDFLVMERFLRAFRECGIKFDDTSFPSQINHEYLETIVTLDKVVDGAPVLLAHLKERGPVYILSNGFKSLQHRKLKSGKLDGYIDKLVLSEDINVTKPHRGIFDYALSVVGGSPETTVMIGDNYDADIMGAHNAGWKTIFFDRTNCETPGNVFDLRVTDLKEIIKFI